MKIFCTKQWSNPDPKFYLGLRSGKIKRIRIRLKRTPRMAIFFCDVLTLPHVKHLMGMIIFVFITYWSETEFLVLKMYGKYDNKDERWMYWEPRKISQAVELSVQGYEDSQQIYSHTIYTVSYSKRTIVIIIDQQYLSKSDKNKSKNKFTKHKHL